MSTATLVSVEEYLADTTKPYPEYLDGVLRSRSMPTKLHSLIQFLLIVLLRKQGVEALSEVSIRPTATRFLVPDVVADKEIESPYPTKPVALCVEVLSPADRLSAVFAKCEEFHAWGSPYCWVIDPLRQKAWEYHANSGPVMVDRAGTLHAGDLLVPMEELFSAVEAELKG